MRWLKPRSARPVTAEAAAASTQALADAEACSAMRSPSRKGFWPFLPAGFCTPLRPVAVAEDFEMTLPPKLSEMTGGSVSLTTTVRVTTLHWSFFALQ